ncbi:MAG: Ppx/GppA phosphatase family protein, partial [Dehalococcoidia bacterium]
MPVPIAAIDVGSNSVRVAVMAVSPHGSLEVIEEARAVPRLIRDVAEHGEFTPETIANLMAVLADFRRLADAAGAEVVAVATSAARDAANGPALVERIRTELGIDLRVISGDEEAGLAFLGATHSLPVTDGVVIDIGGGSMEVVRFQDRRAAQTWTLPLGAVRLTDRFLTSDPLVTSELR